MEKCIALGHLVEFKEEKSGEITWHCVPCDKDFMRYQDCCAGR